MGGRRRGICRFLKQSSLPRQWENNRVCSQNLISQRSLPLEFCSITPCLPAELESRQMRDKPPLSPTRCAANIETALPSKERLGRGFSSKQCITSAITLGFLWSSHTERSKAARQLVSISSSLLLKPLMSPPSPLLVLLVLVSDA